jgi:predicted O-linked N-acetylglucosamine transferase (SPINDLY family)
LIAWTKGVKEHLDLYRRVDIALDTVPYNGTTTTCESLWMGVPVITLRGGVHAGCVGSSILNAVGLPDLVAADADGFVESAAALAADPARLSELRAGLRARMAASPLRDESAFASRFEAALAEVWRFLCRGG